MIAPNNDVAKRARGVKALILDVDGVLTDATLIYGPRGEALKRFSVRDGFAIKLIQSLGIPVGILSGRLAPPLKARLADLSIASEFTIQGSRNKGHDIELLAERLKVSMKALCFVGDDLPDLPAVMRVGFAACPADAVPEVRDRCHLVTKANGGQGAVREVIEELLKARGQWASIVSGWETATFHKTFYKETGKGTSHAKH